MPPGRRPAARRRRGSPADRADRTEGVPADDPPRSKGKLRDPIGPMKPRRTAGLRRVRGPWRVAVVEASMAPAIEPGDWLLIDPTTVRWPRRGSVVIFRE